jgi:hypothetical protein
MITPEQAIRASVDKLGVKDTNKSQAIYESVLDA